MTASERTQPPLRLPPGVRALAVYHFVGCPYCTRVRSAEARLTLASRGISLAWRDIDEDARHRRDLVRARGRATVPVLRFERDDGEDVWLPESLDIVAWLERLASGEDVALPVVTDTPRGLVAWVRGLLGRS